MPCPNLPLLAAVLALCVSCDHKSDVPPLPTATPDTVAAAPAQPTVAEQLNSTDTLAGALGVLANSFEPKQKDGIDTASAALAVWGGRHFTWAMIAARPETKRALVMKDPEAEIGKRLCWSGTVIEIATDRSTGFPIYTGGLIDYNADVLSFYAVGSSGDLVEHSPARICGIVTGSVAYSNSGGGVTHSVRVVGMFDLPQNKPTASK